MTKKELIETLQKLDIPFNEAILSDDDVESFEHINFWDYVWTPLPASSSSYSFTVTYQISFISGKPRSEKLLELNYCLNKIILFKFITNILLRIAIGILIFLWMFWKI